MSVLTPLRPRGRSAETFDVRIVQWSFLRSLMTDRQRALYDYWLAGSGLDGFDIADFDPLRVWDSIGYLHIVHHDPARDDFFYRLSGDLSGGPAAPSLHKRWVTNQAGMAGGRFHAHYCEVMTTRQPWLGEIYADKKGLGVPYWNRMVLPMVDAAAPDRFTCLSLAEPKDHLPFASGRPFPRHA